MLLGAERVTKEMTEMCLQNGRGGGGKSIADGGWGQTWDSCLCSASERLQGISFFLYKMGYRLKNGANSNGGYFWPPQLLEHSGCQALREGLT